MPADKHMPSSPRKRRPFSARTLRWVGIALGALITAGLVITLLQDRQARRDAASRQSLALAHGVDRLLHYELRNLERAMSGIAADADVYERTVPAQAHALVSDAVEGVVARHPELESIVLLDPSGDALSRGSSDASLGGWVATAETSVAPHRLVQGPLTRGASGWVVPLALRTGNGDWLVAKLKTSELHRMIEHLDTGKDGSVGITDRNGVVLARMGVRDGFIGRAVPLPENLREKQSVSIEAASKLDGVARSTSYSEISQFPMVVAAGISLHETLATWRTYAWAAGALIALYWLGMGLTLTRLAAAERAREALLIEMEAQADWLTQAQLAARSGVWRIESENGAVRASAQAAALFGFEERAGNIELDRFFDRMHPADRPRVQDEFAAARQTGGPFHSEYRILLPQGGERWISARGAVAADATGARHMAGTIVDITERRDVQNRVERAEQQFRELFERNPLPFWVFDTETLCFLAVNDAALEAYGYTREQFLSSTVYDIRPADQHDAVRILLSEGIPDEGPKRTWIHQTRDGRRFDVRVYSRAIVFEGRPARLVLAEDVSDRVAYEQDLAWRATHDAATGLLMLPTLIAQVDAEPRDPGANYAVAYVQLRDLELVAPTQGQQAGASIVREASRRLEEVGKQFGLSAYVPADSFVLVAREAERRDEMVAQVLAALDGPVHTEAGPYRLEAWIGLAYGSHQDEGAEQVIGHAALAALRARRDNVLAVPYERALADQASARLALVGRLREAVQRDEFELFYQPIRQLDDGKVVSLEALLRWRQADGSFVPPNEFIPLAEESGLIVPIGARVLEHAAIAHRRLTDRGLGHVSIAVNVSALQFHSPDLPETLRQLRELHGLPAGAIHVELTESAVLKRPDAALEMMRELRGDGARISIDDFGTGFSSMAYLRDLPLDYLKIDRTFVADVASDRRNASICVALIALGHGLGLRIIAEGVETAQQLEWLVAHGCDQAQGYFIARPTTFDEMVAAAFPAGPPT
ncbi:MAG: phosphodiesterase [Lysobacteraceae bacterium]|nr:MAG: phosphodiesterase [Xanthomonadaceae bacterium]